MSAVNGPVFHCISRSSTSSKPRCLTKIRCWIIWIRTNLVVGGGGMFFWSSNVEVSGSMVLANNIASEGGETTSSAMYVVLVPQHDEEWGCCTALTSCSQRVGRDLSGACIGMLLRHLILFLQVTLCAYGYSQVVCDHKRCTLRH